MAYLFEVPESLELDSVNKVNGSLIEFYVSVDGIINNFI
jgi:hypothetical protein